MPPCDLTLPVITGPTGVGKTAVAVKFAKAIGGEIISADSMQVYQQLSIGTAKPTVEETDGVPYHLINHVHPEEQYNLGRFVCEAEVLIKDIRTRKKVPIICGGTGLYIRGLLYGVFNGGEAAPQIRLALEQLEAQYGLPHMYNKLRDVDRKLAEKYGSNDRKRILRALEVYESTGKPLSSMHEQNEASPRHDSRIYRLSMPREELYQRINLRVDCMLKAGLVKEVESYISLGFSRHNPALSALGYRELMEAIEGERTIDSAVAAMKQKSRNYAKRQETWFRAMPNATIIDCHGKNPTQISKQILHDWEKQ